MTKIIVLFLSTAIVYAANPFAGRWDINIKTGTKTSPRWMELVEKKDGSLAVRVQPAGGAVRDIAGAKMDGDHLVLSVDKDTSWQLSAKGDSIEGTQKSGDKTAEIVGVRAPKLDAKMPDKWKEVEKLFTGTDLSGWEPVGGGKNNWTAKDGELVNTEKGANLVTTKKFKDFRIHFEVQCGEHCNSGVYLRGRYEIQMGTEGSTDLKHEMGAVYGYLQPQISMQTVTDQWNVFEVTLVGRHVTIVRNRIEILESTEIPGITGGALDSNEGEPGPIMIQGDHGAVKYRNIIVSEADR